MPDLKNVSLQIRYTEDDPWIDMRLACIDLLNNGRIKLSYYTRQNHIEFYEATYDELIKGDGTARFIEKN